MLSKITGRLKVLATASVPLGRTTTPPTALTPFEQMEQRIAQIQYFYRRSDLPLAARQTVTYQKLMKLDYFTPETAQRVLRDWHEKFTATQS